MNAEHIAKNPARNVLKVGYSLFYIGVVNALECGYKFIDYARIAVLDIVVIFLEHRERFLHYRDVFEHEYVRVENRRLCGAYLLGQFRLYV